MQPESTRSWSGQDGEQTDRSPPAVARLQHQRRRLRVDVEVWDEEDVQQDACVMLCVIVSYGQKKKICFFGRDATLHKSIICLLFANMNKDLERRSESWQRQKLNSLNRRCSHDGDAFHRR